MKEGKIKGLLLDLSQKMENNKSIIQIFLRTKEGLEVINDSGFQPYFYAALQEKKSEKELLAELQTKIPAVKIERDEPRGQQVYRIYFESTKDLVFARKEIRQFDFVQDVREHDIPFTRRYAINKGLRFFNFYEVKVENGILKSIQESAPEKFKLKMACLDLETFSLGRFSDPKLDPIIMAAYTDDSEHVVFTTKKVKADYVQTVADEKELIQKLVDKIKERQPEAIVTYNGDKFDWPYLIERAKQFSVKLDVGFEGSAPYVHTGFSDSVSIKGLIHIDTYQMLRLLSRLAVVSLVKFDLESVVAKVLGIDKEKIQAKTINEIWESEKGLENLAQYNLEDVQTTLQVTEKFLPIALELSRLTKLSLFDVVRTTASGLVESLLINKAFESGMLVPNRPAEEQVKHRLMQSFKGGFVKEPVAGLHENIAVLDFRSLYPTVIISHNVSPETLDCGHAQCEQGKNLAPTKHWFCQQKESQGFLPQVLDEILGKRIEAKQAMKKLEKNSEEFNQLHAQQMALKILLNSHYGYLAYARSRWYSRECASAITAWSRHYIQRTSEQAEKEGLSVLYGDTDSVFLTMPPEQGEKEALEFIKKINTGLPGNMELEFEGMFKRGIFVTKKEGGAAKKRYALIDFENNLKIVGFEYVRRDWAPVAKNTQRTVLELVLKEGQPEQAVAFVRKTIEDLKKGATPKKDLVIMTQISKPISAYETMTPHISAAKKAIARGQELGVGSVIAFVIKKTGGKAISERAEMEEFIQEGEYDSDYYIKNQVVPAVIKIMKELGYNEEDLIQGGKQSSLSAFM